MVSKMRCVRAPKNDGVLVFEDVPVPAVGPDDLLVRVAAAGLNRLDLLQKFGRYPVPPGESDILGVEASGIVEKVGDNVTTFSVGDRVCALIGGGGYADYVIVPSRHAIPTPNAVSDVDAAAIPEAWLTAYGGIFWSARMVPGETILIHAGASGVGTAAIQLVRQLLAVPRSQILCTVGSEEKAAFCQSLGADHAINYKTDDFVAAVKEYTNGKGVDVVLDFVGGPYWEKNLECLALDGRLVLLGMLGGFESEQKTNTGTILRKRLTVVGSTLRNRSADYKGRLVQEFSEHCLGQFELGRLKPIIHGTFPLEKVEEAHACMAGNNNTGKILLTMS